jgi:hypothetical protein
MPPTFREVTDTLCLTAAEIGQLFGVKEQTARQMRLDPSAASYRRPPDGWQRVLARVALERGGELARLARELGK